MTIETTARNRERGKILRTILLCVLAAAVLLTASPESRALLNPHLKPEPCESCHTKVPTEADGRLVPILDSVFDWHDFGDAHLRMESNANVGKIVLRVTG